MHIEFYLKTPRIETTLETETLIRKVKVKLSLWLNKYHPLKTYPLLNYAPHHAFITSALDGCEWSASRPARS
jgi:hypothetical protein